MQGFKLPFRVGRKQNRSVLDADGHEVVVFRKGFEYLAEEYANFKNNKIILPELQVRKAKLSEIKYYYRFKPELELWFRSSTYPNYINDQLIDETWYGGYPFTYGRFILLANRWFSVHLRFTWWKLKFAK